MEFVQKLEKQVINQFNQFYKNTKKIEKDYFSFFFSSTYLKRKQTTKNTANFLKIQHSRDRDYFPCTLICWKSIDWFIFQTRFKVERVKINFLIFLKNFIKVLENYLVYSKQSIESVSKYLLRTEKCKGQIIQTIELQLKNCDGFFSFKNKPNATRLKKMFSFWSFCERNLNKNKHIRTEKYFSKIIFINLSSSKEGERMNIFFLFESDFSIKEFIINYEEQHLKIEKDSLKTFWKKNKLALFPLFFLKNFPKKVNQSTERIFKKGLKIVEELAKTKNNGLKRILIKKTDLQDYLGFFHFNFKKIGNFLSFFRNYDCSTIFRTQHVISICPIEKEASTFVSALLPCCHTISNLTKKKLIGFFTIDQNFEKIIMNCPCCHLSFPDCTEKYLIFD